MPDILSKRIMWIELLTHIKLKKMGCDFISNFLELKRRYKFKPRTQVFVNTAVESEVSMVFCEPEVFRRFFKCLKDALPSESIFPMQAGNAPAGLQMGNQVLANIFLDKFKERIFLAVNGGNSALAFFDFTLIIYHKSECIPSSKSHLHYERFSRELRRSGYLLQHNEYQKWDVSVDVIGNNIRSQEEGIYFVNAKDFPRWKLPLDEAAKLGWNRTIDVLARRYESIGRELIDINNNLG